MLKTSKIRILIANIHANLRRTAVKGNRRMMFDDGRKYDLIDIGANLLHPLFENDFGDVVVRAKQAGFHFK